jgi:hypothetical protein
MRMGIKETVRLRPTLGPRLPIRPGGGGGGGYGGGGSGGSGGGTTCSPDDQGGGGYCLDGHRGSLPNGPDDSGPPVYSTATSLRAVFITSCPVEEYVEAD